MRQDHASHEMCPYATLGVNPHADVEEIRRAYEARVIAAHPDHGGSEQARRAIEEAWALLSDPARRHAYDLSRAEADAPQPPTKREFVGEMPQVGLPARKPRRIAHLSRRSAGIAGGAMLVASFMLMTQSSLGLLLLSVIAAVAAGRLLGQAVYPSEFARGAGTTFFSILASSSGGPIGFVVGFLLFGLLPAYKLARRRTPEEVFADSIHDDVAEFGEPGQIPLAHYDRYNVELGAIGEIAVAERLRAAAARHPGMRIIHDVTIPGYGGNVDHVVVIGEHVLLVDAKHWRGGAYANAPDGTVLLDGRFHEPANRPSLDIALDCWAAELGSRVRWIWGVHALMSHDDKPIDLDALVPRGEAGFATFDGLDAIIDGIAKSAADHGDPDDLELACLFVLRQSEFADMPIG